MPIERHLTLTLTFDLIGIVMDYPCAKFGNFSFAVLVLSCGQKQTVENEHIISTLPLSTHSAVEMLHDSALYKFMIDIHIDIHTDRHTDRITEADQRKHSRIVSLYCKIYKLTTVITMYDFLTV